MNPLFQDDDNHFCSGVNSPGEVKGLALSGRSIGITATEIRAGLLEELALSAGGMLEVFVDSGAFSEVKFGPSGREVVAPITAKDWMDRFEVYRFVAKAFRSRAFLVAPDAVGDQQQTLERMIELGYIMRGLALHYGCKVIVPVQRGELEAVDFLVSALVALRLPKESIVIGIPSKKSATTPAQLRALAQALKEQGVEAPFHLLGMGPKSKGWAAMVRAIRDSFPQATIYSDSVDIRAQVGRTNGPQGGARRITVAQDRARARGVTGSDIKAAALIEVGTQDARAAAQAARRQGWFDPELESAPGVPLEPGCISYGPGGPFGQEPHQQLLLLTKEV